MEQVIRPGDIVAEVGRATGGRTFVRVVHEPTGRSHTLTGLGARSSTEVTAELLAGLTSELLSLGWVHETEPHAAGPGPAADRAGGE